MNEADLSQSVTDLNKLSNYDKYYERKVHSVMTTNDKGSGSDLAWKGRKRG